MSLKRNKNESVLDFKVRLCENKESYNLTWEQIKDIINEETRSKGTANSYRKWWRRHRQENESSTQVEDFSLTEIDEKMIELDLEKKKKQTITSMYNKVVREEARRQMLFEEFRKSITSVSVPRFEKLPVQVGTRECILGISDIHYGKIFESINNRYNESIALSRMEQIMSESIDFCRKENIEEINIVNCADSIEGMALRISQLNSLEIGFVDQVVRFQRMIVEWLNEFSKHMKIVYHHVPSANHTEIRPLGTKAGQFPAEDMERIISVYIHDMLQNNRRIRIPEYKRDFARFVLNGYLFYAKHGHQIKNLKTAIKDLSMLHHEFISYLLVGHYHHPENLVVSESPDSDCELLMLPSVMGSDEYSDSLHTGAKPGAKLFVIEEGKGKNLTYDIRF